MNICIKIWIIGYIVSFMWGIYLLRDKKQNSIDFDAGILMFFLSMLSWILFFGMFLGWLIDDGVDND
jgi:hypothetical protein